MINFSAVSDQNVVKMIFPFQGTTCWYIIKQFVFPVSLKFPIGDASSTICIHMLLFARNLQLEKWGIIIIIVNV